MSGSAFASQQRRDTEAELMRMGAYERHKRLMRSMELYCSSAQRSPANAPTSSSAPVIDVSNTKSDADVLRDTFRFIRSERDDAELNSWEARLARRYYAKLYREFALADLSRYREGALGLRWRTQAEVVRGRGQFSCGAIGCDQREDLATFEVPFRYREAGQERAALVKLRLCSTHARQLNYTRGRQHDKETDHGHDDGGASGRRRRPRSRSRSSPDQTDSRPANRSLDNDDDDFQQFLAGLAVG